MTKIMDLNISNLSSHSLDLIDGLLAELKGSEVPAFASQDQDLEVLKDEVKRISGKKNIIILGHGGSITTFKGILGSLGRFYKGDREFFLLDTVDPAHIAYIKSRTSPEDSHVIAISKSGNTLTVLELLSVFLNYPTTAVTEPGYGALRKISKTRDWTVIDVP